MVMAKIDTSRWKKTMLSTVFDMANTKSIVQKDVYPDSGHIPYVTASSENNGIMTYISCPDEWIDKGNCIMIGGKTLTFTYQDSDFCSNDSHNIALYIKANGQATKLHYLFLISALRSSLSQRYSWGDSISMKRIKDEYFYIPVDSHGCPDWAYMDSFMAEVMKESEACLENLRLADGKKTAVDISRWKEFEIGKLFPKIKKPPVLHNRQVIEDENGIPYVVRTKFDNGIKCRVQRNDEMKPSPAGVISFGAENATFFYQREEFVSGRDIYYIDTQDLSDGACMFLTACL